MGIVDAELAVQRRVTTAFIRSDAQQITLYRTARLDDGAGGFEMASPAPLSAQTMRYIPGIDAPTRETVADGRRQDPEGFLLAQWDADMQVGDTFTMNGARYEVQSLGENQQYERKGRCIYRGR